MVQGYKFYADSGLNDPLRLVYDGSSNPQINYFNFDKSANEAVELSNQLTYRFQVTAVNFNGEGPRSVIASLQVCTVPSLFKAPVVSQVSSASVQLDWSAPLNNGGCPITSYHIYLMP